MTGLSHSKRKGFSSQLITHALATWGIPRGVVSSREATSRRREGGGEPTRINLKKKKRKGRGEEGGRRGVHGGAEERRRKRRTGDSARARQGGGVVEGTTRSRREVSSIHGHTQGREGPGKRRGETGVIVDDDDVAPEKISKNKENDLQRKDIP